ncbi:MAG: rod shape-determining protein MreD, partial [Elusimicrobia bacterium]|nr:rod shape-determining protein MreD [Elusimicrobiota bacterium]
LQFVLPKYVPFNLWLFYPNFILIFIVYIALNKGAMKGQLTGFFYGLTWDILATDIFGVRALSFTIAGYLAGIFNKKFDKNQPLTQIMVTAIGLIVTQLVIDFVYIVMPLSDTQYIPGFELSFLSLLNILVNLILAPIVFKIFSSVEKL